MSKYTCQMIADYFINLAHDTGSNITNLKLQKLVYYAQAWYLAFYKKPLFNEKFQAWPHGPVNYNLWKKYNKYSYKTITEKSPKHKFDSKVDGFLKNVSEVYFPLEAYTLELMTHREDPWINSRRGLPIDAKCNREISNDSMLTYYANRIK